MPYGRPFAKGVYHKTALNTMACKALVGVAVYRFVIFGPIYTIYNGSCARIGHEK